MLSFVIAVFMLTLGIQRLYRGLFKKRIRDIKVGLGCFLIGFGLAYKPVVQFLLVDICLDNGGRYHYDDGECEGSREH